MSDPSIAVVEARIAFVRQGLASPVAIIVDRDTYRRLLSAIAGRLRVPAEYGTGEALYIDGVRIEQER